MKGALESMVVVPTCQAGVLGLFGGLCACSACLVWGWGLGYAGLCGCVLTFVSFLAFRAEVSRRLDVESGVLSVNADSTPELEPTRELEPLQAFRLEVDYNGNREGDFLTFNLPPETFYAWCSGVAGGKTLAEDTWCGSRGLFSKSQFHTFRNELLNRGFLRMNGKHHAQGFSLSAKGNALIRGVARTHTQARIS